MSRVSHLTAAERLAYYTECQLATVEDLRMRKRFPKSELERQEKIAAGMVQSCREFRDQMRPHRRGGPSCPRLDDTLADDHESKPWGQDV